MDIFVVELSLLYLWSCDTLHFSAARQSEKNAQGKHKEKMDTPDRSCAMHMVAVVMVRWNGIPHYLFFQMQ
jgi:hypothetical protein